jgi:hypothetical protein
MAEIMEDLNYRSKKGLEGSDELVRRAKKLLRLWQENNIFELRLVTGL